MSDEWLEQLRQLHQADKARRQAETQQTQQQQAQRNQASELLQQSKAHTLLRQVQKTLLGGRGQLDIFDRAGDYDRVITLTWQGPISAARKPSANDPEAYNYILVGVRQGKLWVNGKKLPAATPEALKAALLESSRSPGRETRGQ